MIQDSVFLVISLSVLCGLCLGSDLGPLIDGVKTSEVIKLNGSVVNNDAGSVSVSKDESGRLTVIYTGQGTLSVERNSGLSFEVGNQLLDIIKNALGSRYRIITSIKMGGRLLPAEDNKKLNEILEQSKQKFNLFINGEPVSLEKAAILEAGVNSTVLEPTENPGYRIVLTDSSTDVVTSLNQDEVKIVVDSGLNKRQIEIVKENFYNLVADKAAAFTGLPKQLFELVISGRDEIISKLKRILSPAEQIKIGGEIIDVDKAMGKSTPIGTVFYPDNLPQVKITWKNDGGLSIDSKDGSAVEAIYSQGVDSDKIERIVNGLHRAITLRLSMISWSKGFLGSIPPQLKEDLDGLRNQVQKRTVLINGKVLDLKGASVMELSEDSITYGLPGGTKLRIYTSGAISSQGNELTVEFTSGLTENQVNEILSNVNNLFLTSVQLSDSEEELLNMASNRNLVSSLLRGIKTKEILKVDEEILDLSNATVIEENQEFTEYTVDSFEDVIATKFSDGSVQVGGRERTIFISRSTGIPLSFLNRLVTAIQNVMPKKRWFYNIGNKNEIYTKEQKLRSVIDEIPNIIHDQSVLIDGKEVDFEKASILSIDDVSTTYAPDTNSNVMITRFLNGDIQASSDEEQLIVVKVGLGITSQDSQTLLGNIKKLVGDRFEIGPKQPGNYWCSTGDMRKLIGWLLDKIWPDSKINVENRSNDETSSSRRDFSTNIRGEDVIISNYRGRGVNVTSKSGGKFSVSLSTGLTQEISFELVQYLVQLLEDKENVIRMVTGSISEDKVRRIKDMVVKMIHNRTVEIDAQVVPPGDRYKNSTQVRNKLAVITENESGRIQVNGVERHSVSVSVSPGLTAAQAEQLYENIKMAFKDKFSRMTHLPIQVIDGISELKKYFMKSYFYFVAPPKKYICVNHKEISSESPSGRNTTDALNHNIEIPGGVTISEIPDGILNITMADSGSVDVIRSTGFEEEHVDRILRAVEYELGLKNKMLRVSFDELFSSPDRFEKLKPLLQELTLSWRLFVSGIEIDSQRPVRVRKDESCTLSWFKQTGDLAFKTCGDGQVSIDYRERKPLQLQILPGISPEQSEFILKGLERTIRTKSSYIKHLSNYLDTFLLLLADGRIKSLEKIIFTVIPREDIVVDGNRINLDPLELSPDQDSIVNEPNARPGLEITRCKNGSIEIKSWNGGHLDVHCNTGLTLNLVRLILDRFKENTVENIEPYLMLIKDMFKRKSFSTFTILNKAVKQETSQINMTLLVELLEQELKSRIHDLIHNQERTKLIAAKAVQMQEVAVQDELVDWNKCRVVSNGNGAVTCIPDNRSYIKITRYDNGRLEVDSTKEETISVAISAGIPPKMLSSFIETLSNYLKKIDSDEKYLDKVKSKLSYYLNELSDTILKGIKYHQNLTLDNKEILFTEDSLTEETDSVSVYRKDNLLISLNKNGSTEIVMDGAGKLDLDFSSDSMAEPVGSFIDKHAAQFLRDMYKSIRNYEPLVTITTKLKKTLDSLLDSLHQKVYINGKDVDGPSKIVIQETETYKVVQCPDVTGLKITLYKEGKVRLEKENSEERVHILLTNGLSAADHRKMLTNIHRLLSRFNPIELVADILDVLPKNFFMLAQNMDRVMSVMNLIRF